MFQRKKGQKGFTLIELLIVLTILAILVAVVVVSLTTFVGKGKTEACKTDQRSLQTAVVAFYSEAQLWPADAITHDMTWAMDDGTGNTFDPDYIVDTPESDATCNWHVDADGQVYVPNTDTDTCNCCTVAVPPDWCEAAP